MQTPITIECGPLLSIKLTMHEEILCCYSKLLQERFAEAKTLRQQYEQANALRNDIAAHVFPEVTADEFEAGNHQEKVKSQKRTRQSSSTVGIIDVPSKPTSTLMQRANAPVGTASGLPCIQQVPFASL